MSFEATILWFFGIANFINMAAYTPMLRDLLKGKKAGNLWSWALWSASAVSYLLYAIYIVKYRPLIIVSGIFTFLNISTVLLILRVNALHKPQPK